MSCQECQKPFKQSKKMRVALAYCKPCRKKHSKDLLEFISTPDTFVVFDESQLAIAETLLSGQSTDVRLDLHKTLDTIAVGTQLPCETACCVSYVGQLTETRIAARKDIQARIASGQITFGALVFKRGPKRDPELANDFQVAGSKAWFNRLVKSDNPLFIDDSEDHVLSVEKAGVTSQLIIGGQSLLKLIDLHFASDSSDDLFG